MLHLSRGATWRARSRVALHESRSLLTLPTKEYQHLNRSDSAPLSGVLHGQDRADQVDREEEVDGRPRTELTVIVCFVERSFDELALAALLLSSPKTPLLRRRGTLKPLQGSCTRARKPALLPHA